VYFAGCHAAYDKRNRTVATKFMEITEMDHNKAGSFCCGGGGGRAFLEEKEGTKISARRVEMALATGMPVVATNCPFCITMLEDGVKTSNNEAGLRVQDLAELVADRLA